MKRKIFRTVPMIVLALMVLFTFSTTTEAAKRYKHGAKTPPPPAQVQIEGIFDPNHKYLLDGSNLISKYDSNTINLGGTTFATQIVETIGVNIHLQKWNGSSWENVGLGSNYSASNQDRFEKTILRSAESGYYYRVRTIHWVSENGIYEQGERVSDYILLK